MSNKTKAILISVPCAVLLALTLLLSLQFFSAREVVVAVNGYDPRDLLSGHYISYQIDWDRTDCSQFENNECPIAYFEKYKEELSWGGRYRFYIAQADTRKAEDIFNFNGKNVQVVFSYSKHSAPLGKRLLIDGKDWRLSVDD